MLTIFRRHVKACPHRSRKERRCQCPIAVEGTLSGTFVRRTLGLRSWEAAQKRIREWEVRGSAEEPRGITVSDACAQFLEDCTARHLGTAQTGKYQVLTRELMERLGGRHIAAVSVEELRDYRASWDLSPVTAQKKLERLRTFFRFCVDSGWIATNPARLVKGPNVKAKPTLPVDDADFEKLLRDTETYPKKGVCGADRGARIKAFLLVLRYSGLRIRDCVTLTRDKLKGNRLFLYAQKTGVPVWLPLPPFVVDALERSAKVHEQYFFWSGNGNPKSAVADWQRSLARLAELAGVKFHAHQLRDTFAVSLLSKGVSLETVAILLGNSVRICERHYAPWVKSRQEKLEEAVKATW